jgi:hypothetical protein
MRPPTIKEEGRGQESVERKVDMIKP